MDVATETTMGAAPIPVSAPTSTFHLTVVPANIATSIPYRQYCFVHHSCGLDEEAEEELRALALTVHV